MKILKSKDKIIKSFLFLFIIFLICQLKPIHLIYAQEEKTIAQAKIEGGIQTISGYVTAPPALLSNQYFYIQDETAGIQVYKYEGNFPTLSLGQKVRIKGEVYEAYQEFRIKISSIEVFDEIRAIYPKEVPEINESNEGQLVSLRGLYLKSYSGGFYIKVKEEEVKISIQANTKISKPKMERDDLISVVGIASQYNDSYRLLPRFQDDIKILEKGRKDEEVVSTFEDEEEITPLIPIKLAKTKEKGSRVLIEGIVSASPGTFSNRYFYIQDQTSGIQVYFSKEDWPELPLGWKIRVLGELSEAYNEKRIKISQKGDISILGKDKEVSPLSLKTGQIKEEQEGLLVSVRGKIIEPSGNIFYLDDGSGKIKIYLDPDVKIEKPPLKSGVEIMVIGIVSQYKDTYRILPRQNDDLKTASGTVLAELEKLEEGGEEEKEGENKVLGANTKKLNNNFSIFFIIILGLGFLGAMGYDLYLKKRERNPEFREKVNAFFARWRDYLSFGRIRNR